MDEDLDRTVERIASLLLSDKAVDIESGSGMLDSVARSSGSSRLEAFSRLAQELAAYQGGAILEHLLAGAVWKRRPTVKLGAITLQEIGHAACYLVLKCLTSNKAVVDRCLKDTGIGDGKRAEEIYRGICRDAEAWARALERGQKNLNTLVTMLVVTPLECITNFAFASGAFRKAMRRASEERSLFEQLGFFLSPQFLKLVSNLNSRDIRDVLSNLVTALVRSTDSQLWALDRGLLRLMAALYESSPAHYRQETLKRNDAPAFRCNCILLLLLSTEATTKKLLEHNVIDGFRPYRRKMNDAAEPEIDLWGYLSARLLGGEELPPLEHPITLKVLSCPVVCSWKLCTAGPESAETKFGKCGHCHVARYCSKEHQKLHWATHKAHCQASRAKETDPRKGENKETPR